MSGAEELVEWIDDDDRVLEVVARSVMRRRNLLHRSVAVVVTTTDGRLVIQRRSPHKDVFPNWWDIGAGGVVAAGEDPDTAARRELYEELGVDATPEFVGTGRHDDDEAREICRIYRLVHDGPFEPVDGEAVEVLAVTVDEFAALSGAEPFLPGSLALLLPHVPAFESACGRPALSGVPWGTVQRVEFTIEPFVEANPGIHVTAPVDALRAMGVDVEIGPFGSGCDVDADQVGEVVGAIVRVAVEHGATHVNVDVSEVTP